MAKKKRKMKTYYLTLSEVFPSYHPRAGQPTNFERYFRNAQICAKCKELSPKGMCIGECVAGCRKRHTIRANYDFWAKRFEKIAAGDAELSIRVWVGKPYGKGSTQREIARLTREDGIGLQKLRLYHRLEPVVYAEGLYKIIEPMNLASNDGLSFNDWYDWFNGYDFSKPMAIIHFTKFRY